MNYEDRDSGNVVTGIAIGLVVVVLIIVVGGVGIFYFRASTAMQQQAMAAQREAVVAREMLLQAERKTRAIEQGPAISSEIDVHLSSDGVLSDDDGPIEPERVDAWIRSWREQTQGTLRVNIHVDPDAKFSVVGNIVSAFEKVPDVKVRTLEQKVLRESDTDEAEDDANE